MIRLGAPISTYRIQFSKDFRFPDCRDVVPYLHALGIGAVYSSPRFRARRGSSHGYDVANPERVNSELGAEDEFEELCTKLKSYGMGLLLDIVPNHMAASHENPWWMDVLQHGPASRYAGYFDIDWHPAAFKAGFLLDNRVLLPVLGELYGTVLENGELSLRLDENGFFIQYYDRRFPVDPGTWEPVLEHCIARLGADHPAAQELDELREAARQMPLRTATTAEQVERRRAAARELEQRLFAPYRDQLEVRLAVDGALREFSGTAGDAPSFDRLHRLLENQAYRLACWKIAYEEINYRRFFDINDLVCLRAEEAEVFDARHETILQLIRQRNVSGLRVDHVDGLHDPAGYLARLREAAGSAGSDSGFYIVVEKVLGREEALPAEWPVQGTTGYDFLNALNELFIEPAGWEALESVYSAFTAEDAPFAEICYARNKQVMWKLFAGEVHALGQHLGRLAAQDLHARDVPVSELMRALVEVTACLPVYRTYIRTTEVPPRDRSFLERTLALARRRTPETEVCTPAFEFLRRVLLLDPPHYARERKAEWLSFVARWQKFTGPVMAKGLEDTAFYAHNTLISRNEVGGDALREAPPQDLEGFHGFNQRRLAEWPSSLNATSTHDTKRSEDVRARLNVLSEIPEEWGRRLARWSRANRNKKSVVHGREVPVPSEEVMLYQTMLGAWPPVNEGMERFPERVKEFALKAVREAKTHSGWILQDEAHESAVLRFVDAILEPAPTNTFLRDFLRFQKKVAWHGALNSLAQVLIKIAAPGVPDFYQGTELWSLALVDPDNRRPVDFALRIGLLEELRSREAGDRNRLLRDLLARWEDGRIKLYLTDKALDFRRAHAELFRQGGYLPLAAAGARAGNLCAFARQATGSWTLCVTPRWTTQLTPRGRPPLGRSCWQDTSLLLPEDAPARWRNVLTGETLETVRAAGSARHLLLQDVYARFPVALLTSPA